MVCAVSAATGDELVADYGVHPDRIAVTPEAPNVTPATAPDDAVFDRLGVRGPYVLNVGTIEPRKNQVTLIEALVAAGAELAGHTLVLAGTPGWGQREVDDALDRCGRAGASSSRAG